MDLEMPPDVVVSKPKEPSLWFVGGHKGVVHRLKVYGLVLVEVGENMGNNGGIGFYL